MSRSKQIVTIALLTAALALPAAIGRSGGDDIVETARNAGQFETLLAALDAADLDGALKGKGPFTVFAPSDEAFAKVPKRTLESLLKPENRDQLTAILTYHVVAGELDAAAVTRTDKAETLNGQAVDFSVNDGTVRVDKARVVSADIRTRNGVIHVIDRVLMPSGDDLVQTAANAGSFKTLLAAAEAAGLVDTLKGEGPLTVFAPTDRAFERLPQGTVQALLRPENRDALAQVLTYHVVPGRVRGADAVAARTAASVEGGELAFGIDDGRLRVNDARVTSNDIDASNGVIHVIDRVLIPVDFTLAAATLNPLELIDLAIERGVPEFNNGDAKACAAIYELTAQSLVSLGGDAIGEPTRTMLREAVGRAASTHDDRRAAWILRDALDETARMLERQMAMSSRSGH